MHATQRAAAADTHNIAACVARTYRCALTAGSRSCMHAPAPRCSQPVAGTAAAQPTPCKHPQPACGQPLLHVFLGIALALEIPLEQEVLGMPATRELVIMHWRGWGVCVGGVGWGLGLVESGCWEGGSGRRPWARQPPGRLQARTAEEQGGHTRVFAPGVGSRHPDRPARNTRTSQFTHTDSSSTHPSPQMQAKRGAPVPLPARQSPGRTPG